MEMIVDSNEQLVELFAKKVASMIENAQQQDRPFALMLAGGQSPIPLYHKLVEVVGSWRNVSLLLGDERYVSAADALSNGRMIQEHLISQISIEDEQIIFPDTRLSIEEAARSYSSILNHYIGENGAIDLAILGMGEDGHTLSLFPGDTASLDSDELYLATKVKDPWRLSGTFRLLKHCREICVMAPGASKLRVYQQSKEKTFSDKFPVAQLHLSQFNTHWFLTRR